MKFDIAKSKNQGRTYFIARDSSGNVRLRAASLEMLQKEIETYEPPVSQDHSKTKQIISQIELKEAKKEATKQLINDLAHPKKAFDNKLRAELAKRAEQKLKKQVLEHKAALSQKKK